MTSNEFIAEQINKIWMERMFTWKNRIDKFLSLQNTTWIDYVKLLVSTQDEMKKIIQDELKK